MRINYIQFLNQFLDIKNIMNSQYIQNIIVLSIFCVFLFAVLKLENDKQQKAKKKEARLKQIQTEKQLKLKLFENSTLRHIKQELKHLENKKLSFTSILENTIPQKAISKKNIITDRSRGLQELSTQERLRKKIRNQIQELEKNKKKQQQQAFNLKLQQERKRKLQQKKRQQQQERIRKQNEEKKKLQQKRRKQQQQRIKKLEQQKQKKQKQKEQLLKKQTQEQQRKKQEEQGKVEKLKKDELTSKLASNVLSTQPKQIPNIRNQIKQNQQINNSRPIQKSIQKNNPVGPIKQNKIKKKKPQQLNKISAQQYLESLIQFSHQFKEEAAIPFKTNSVGDFKKVVKDFLQLTHSILNSFNFEQNQKVNTFMVMVWDMIVNKLLKSAKKQGLQDIPPCSVEEQVEKNCINTYILFINTLRVYGYQKIWTFFVGKTLSLLDFIYKRKGPLKSYKELDLIAKNYLKFSNKDFQQIYVSRMDQLTYFLFGLCVINPYDSFKQISQRTKIPIDRNLQFQLQKLNKPWDYSTFWILSSCIRKTQFKYFKPICYLNIIALLYIQVRKQLKQKNDGPFMKLSKKMIQEGLTFEKLINADPELKMLQETEVQNFDGDNLFDLIEPKTKTVFKQKKRLYQNLKDYRVFEQKASIFYYFKIQQPK